MKKTLWALMDDRMGSVGQARGILQALNDELDISEKKIVYNRLAKLPNCLKGVSLLGIDKSASSALEKPWPDAVLSISRRTTPVARWIKKQSGGKTKIIQLMFPGKCGLDDLDLVIVPEHDAKAGNAPNLFYITGCPHRVSLEYIREAQSKWAPAFADLPRPLLSVIVGGSIKGAPFSEENARALGQSICQIKKRQGGSVLITSSRRTGAAAEKAIMEELAGIPLYTFLWGEKKENPFAGFLACADMIAVTGDSVSMCCETCGAGKPVGIFIGKNWLTPKHLRFVESLYQKGYALPLEDPDFDKFAQSERLDPIPEIIDKIREII